MVFGSYVTQSHEQTLQLGQSLGAHLQPNSIVAFFGDLGAGKTTFIRGLALGAAATEPRDICSPTFTYLNIYKGPKTLYHFDLYRLPSEREFFAAGFDEYFTMGGICCIEWAEKIEGALPKGTLFVRLAYLSEGQRQIEIINPAPK